jgi:hypothetical protein
VRPLPSLISHAIYFGCAVLESKVRTNCRLACHAVSGRSTPPAQGRGAEPTGLLEETVIVRWTLLVTAPYGTRVARPTRTTRPALGGYGCQLAQKVRPIPGRPQPRGKSPRARGRLVRILEL